MATNGIIAVNEPSSEEKYLGQFPVSFGAIAPFMADLDTTDGRGNVYYREDSSSDVLRLASDYIKRGFPETTFDPSSVVVVTWKLVAPYQAREEGHALEEKVSFKTCWTHVQLKCNTVTCCFEGLNSFVFNESCTVKNVFCCWKGCSKIRVSRIFTWFLFYSILFIQKKMLESA